MACQQPKTIGETSATCNLLSSNVFILNKLNIRSAYLQGLHFQGLNFKVCIFEVCVFKVCIFYRFLDTPKK